MNAYNVILFLHVSGDIGIFIGIGLEWFGLMALRRAQYVEQTRTIAWLITIANRVSTGSAVLTIASGLYMALTVWGLQTGWIAVTLASLVVLLAPLLVGIIEPRMRVIVTATQKATDGPLPATLSAHIHDPVLGTALQTVTAVVLGIVFLMTNKPSLGAAILVMGIFLMLGLALSLLLWRAARAKRARSL
ncbi:hypothetical protein TFLX_03630 [Thermoflexales bacterium]|nr:hypothetical protein TFLX_03630 [Thermoflexales bacterium]